MSTRLVNTEKLKNLIIEELPIDEVAERLCDVELQDSGIQKKGLCPIHGEDTPSFYCHPGKNLYHCFGCKEGGDGIDLVRKVRHLGYYDALYLLAEEAGVDIEQFERPLTEEEKHREAISAWCEEWLAQAVDDMCNVAALGKARFDNVGLIREFGVGKSHKRPTGAPKGVHDLERNELFNNTIVFPYRTPGGRLVGWKSRSGDGETKQMYGTSRDFPLTAPALFGLHVARDYIEDGRLYVVEGEYDCLAMHEAGIRNVAALGGSAFTDDHYQLLQDLNLREVVFLLDADEGGEKAALLLAERYWEGKPQIKLATLPEGMDPEDAIKGQLGDPALVQNAIAFAKHALEYIMWREWTSKPRNDMSAKLEFVEWVREHFGKKLVPPVSDIVAQEIAKWMGLPDVEVLDLVRTDASQLQAVDSERIVLGRCIRDQGYYTDLRKRFRRDDFFKMRHRRVWEALEQILVDNLEFEVTTIKQRADEIGVDPSYIEELAQHGESNMAWHEDRILDLSVRRTARDAADRFRELIADVSVDSTMVIGDLTQRVAEKALGTRPGLSPISEQTDRAMETLHERMANPTAIHGIDLGSQLPETTRTLQGMQQRRFALMAAASGVGKTTICAQIATNISIYESIPADFISLEMDEVELLFKIASHMTQIPAEKISGGSLDDSEAKLVEMALARVRKSPLRIYAPDGMTTNEFILYARESVMERRTELFVVDYVQLISPDPGQERLDSYTLYGNFGREAKMRVARAMDTSVLAVAQLNRAAAEKERPTKEDMGDSYDLVRHADVIMLIKKNEGKTHDFWIEKNRQGRGNKLVPLVFDEEKQTLYEATAPKEPTYLVRHVT